METFEQRLCGVFKKINESKAITELVITQLQIQLKYNILLCPSRSQVVSASSPAAALGISPY
jgi:hypothetical protein